MTDLSNPIYHDNDAARRYLEAIRWPDGPYCPHCGVFDGVHRLGGKAGAAKLLHCRTCRKKFTITVGTLFERSHIPLHKWLLATHLISASKKGMSAHQLHRMLGVTYKTAWFMAHRIREAMRDANPDPIGGQNKVVEADETYVGGTAKNRAFDPPPKKEAVERNDAIHTPFMTTFEGNDLKYVPNISTGPASAHRLSRKNAPAEFNEYANWADKLSKYAVELMGRVQRPGDTSPLPRKPRRQRVAHS